MYSLFCDASNTIFIDENYCDRIWYQLLWLEKAMTEYAVLRMVSI